MILEDLWKVKAFLNLGLRNNILRAEELEWDGHTSWHKDSQ